MAKNVHTEHCCVVHGCKYGDFDCPVWLGRQRQSYACESCSDHIIPMFPEPLPDMPSYDVLKKRNDECREEFFTDGPDL